jgi:hypothetical protein
VSTFSGPQQGLDASCESQRFDAGMANETREIQVKESLVYADMN